MVLTFNSKLTLGFWRIAFERHGWDHWVVFGNRSNGATRFVNVALFQPKFSWSCWHECISTRIGVATPDFGWLEMGNNSYNSYVKLTHGVDFSLPLLIWIGGRRFCHNEWNNLNKSNNLCIKNWNFKEKWCVAEILHFYFRHKTIFLVKLLFTVWK